MGMSPSQTVSSIKAPVPLYSPSRKLARDGVCSVTADLFRARSTWAIKVSMALAAVFARLSKRGSMKVPDRGAASPQF